MVLSLGNQKTNKKMVSINKNANQVIRSTRPKVDDIIVTPPKPLELPISAPRVADTGELIFNERVIFNSRPYVHNDFVIKDKLFVKGKSILENTIIKGKLQLKEDRVRK